MVGQIRGRRIGAPRKLALCGNGGEVQGLGCGSQGVDKRESASRFGCGGYVGGGGGNTVRGDITADVRNERLGVRRYGRAPRK